MANVPVNLRDNDLSRYLISSGYPRIHQGKVRDTYGILGDTKNLLVVATDRISIFDFVLNALVPKKGEVLTALTHFWMTKVLQEFENHLIPSKYLNSFNAAYDLRKNLIPELDLRRSLVVKNLKETLYPFEMIFRHHLGGSVFKKYQQTGMAGGYLLEEGLAQWSKLALPLFTPSTKAEVGHDINIDADYFFQEMSKKGLEKEAHNVVEMIVKLYQKAYTFAQEKGVLILDTKLEVAGKIIVDEILTPDSSRFVFESDWKEAMAESRDPQFLDKQNVREWGKLVETPFSKNGKQIIGINNLDPESPQHIEFIKYLFVPEKVREDTTKRYLNLFEMITGAPLDEYQKTEMGV